QQQIQFETSTILDRINDKLMYNIEPRCKRRSRDSSPTSKKSTNLSPVHSGNITPTSTSNNYNNQTHASDSDTYIPGNMEEELDLQDPSDNYNNNHVILNDSDAYLTDSQS